MRKYSKRSPVKEKTKEMHSSVDAIDPRGTGVRSDNLGPIQMPKSLTEIAYGTLKVGILSGKLVVGKIYNELGLARKLGISRTPIREALLKLEVENFVVFHPRKEGCLKRTKKVHKKRNL